MIYLSLSLLSSVTYRQVVLKKFVNVLANFDLNARGAVEISSSLVIEYFI
jgi:hypothetical protein